MGNLQPYTLLNELESEYGEILGYLRKIGKDDRFRSNTVQTKNCLEPYTKLRWGSYCILKIGLTMNSEVFEHC